MKPPPTASEIAAYKVRGPLFEQCTEIQYYNYLRMISKLWKNSNYLPSYLKSRSVSVRFKKTETAPLKEGEKLPLKLYENAPSWAVNSHNRKQV